GDHQGVEALVGNNVDRAGAALGVLLVHINLLERRGGVRRAAGLDLDEIRVRGAGQGGVALGERVHQLGDQLQVLVAARDDQQIVGGVGLDAEGIERALD